MEPGSLDLGDGRQGWWEKTWETPHCKAAAETWDGGLAWFM